MSRAIWKGAISFGLVHIPVAMHSASSSQGIDFDWLDKRSMEPVGYKRINKITGKEITAENIVKGIQYEKGRYIILSEEEIRAAHPATTQTIDIFAFVNREEIPLTHIENPYYLAPDKRGEKVYALLQKTLSDTNKVALTNVVVHTKQYLAALMPIESTLVLLLLRWPTEVRPLSSVELSKTTTDAKFTKGESDMAKRLVEDMTATWDPESYHDTFQEKIMALVDKKARDGEIENVEAAPEDVVRKSADVIDLTELLKQSLRGKSDKPSPKSGKAKVTAIKPSAEKSSNGKSSRAKSKSEPKSAAAKSTKAESAKSDATKSDTSKKTKSARK